MVRSMFGLIAVVFAPCGSCGLPEALPVLSAMAPAPMSCCGAMPSTPASFGLVLLVFGALLLPGVEAVCPHCSGNFASCFFDSSGKCPTVSVVESNGAIMKAGVGSLVMTGIVQLKYLRSFSRVAMDAVLNLVGRPAPGTTFTIDTSTTGSAILTAVGNGMTTVEAAVVSLLDLVEQETDATVVAKLKSRIEALKVMKESKSALGDLSGSSVTDFGIYTYIWYKSSEYVMRVRESISLATSLGAETSSASSSRAGLSATLHRPKKFEEFAEMMNMFVMYCHSLAVLSAVVLTDFFETAVYDTIRLRGKPWYVAHEMLLILFSRSEDSGGKLKLCQACEEVYLNTVLDQAEFKAKLFFRPLGGNPNPLEGNELEKDADGKGPKVVVWNQKDTPSSSTLCPIFNGPPGSKHQARHLLPDGTCRFKHACNKWVSNKGPGGRCESLGHGRYGCSNPDKCEEKVTS